MKNVMDSNGQQFTVTIEQKRTIEALFVSALKFKGGFDMKYTMKMGTKGRYNERIEFSYDDVRLTVDEKVEYIITPSGGITICLTNLDMQI